MKDRKRELKLSEADIAEFCGWHKSKVAHKLAGRTDITLEELELLCGAMKLPISEAVRDRGLEFYAEVTPTELRLIETWRMMPEPIRGSFLLLMNVQPRDIERRGVTPKRSLYGKPRPR